MKNIIQYIPDGIPNLQPLFPNIDLSQAEEWYVQAIDSNGVILATTKKYTINCCCNEKVRIHFVNSLGEIDSVNFSRAEINEEVKSESWTKSLGFPFDRTKGGSYRQNIKSIETYDVETKCYGEDDQVWIKELFKTNNAWIEMLMPNGLLDSDKKEYVPIVIVDSKITTKKVEKRYEYLVKLKFVMSNSGINLR